MAETTVKVTNVSALTYVLENVELPEEIKEKIEKIKSTFENKSGHRKPTARQEENVGVKADLLEALKAIGTGATITDILASDKDKFEGITCQRASALLKKMVEEDKTVEKYVEKKKPYFKAL